MLPDIIFLTLFTSPVANFDIFFSKKGKILESSVLSF
jgi:hypothetical protein